MELALLYTYHKNIVLPKEQVKNADLHKPVLNKMMTTRELCTKYSFVAPLRGYTLSLKSCLAFSST